ncbi:MAG: hypothetical protein WDW38_005717 [Sanguina aurantia]
MCPCDDIANQDGVSEVLTVGQQLRQHPVGKLLVDQDHLFQAMELSGQIKELRCFYDSKASVFHTVVLVGKDVCGHPQTVHGGLTAAIIDETFGGLAVSVWLQGKLGVISPPYTARLEVDYKAKIPAGSLLMVSSEVESVDDRKVWMRARVTDGEQVVYATARALFVSPRMLPKSISFGGGNVLGTGKVVPLVSSSSSGSASASSN